MHRLDADNAEMFIPIRSAELIDLLCAVKTTTHENFSLEDQERFRLFADRVSNHFHQEQRKLLTALKDAYAFFDPDADTMKVYMPNAEEMERNRDALFRDFVELLKSANYRHLSRQEIEMCIKGASAWGVDMHVNWDIFERVEMFVRGKAIGQRPKRHPWRFWKTRMLSIATFQRTVVILKLKTNKNLGADVDVNHIFLKLFKDIPEIDLEMLLPGTELKMPKLQRGKLGATVASSIGYVGWKLSAVPIASMLAGSMYALVVGLYTPLVLIVGYGYKTYAGFQTAKQTYQLKLTQSLLFQNLDNNAGVIYRLVGEAQEQEVREVLLAYYFLWRFAGAAGWSAETLDGCVELELGKFQGRQIDFEVADALRKLKNLKLLASDEPTYRVIPLEQAIDQLDPCAHVRSKVVDSPTS